MRVKEVSRDYTLVYEKGNELSHIIGKLHEGEEVEIETEYDGWVKIKDGGWCRASDTEPVTFDAGGSGGGSLPFLKITTSDGENYESNMTYEEAAALIESMSLLGGCIVWPDGVSPCKEIMKDQYRVTIVFEFDEVVLNADGTIEYRESK